MFIDTCQVFIYNDPMEHRDGNIGAWLDDQQAAIAKLSAGDIGVKFPPEWYRTFLRTLDEDPDARNLRDFLPQCNVPALASFTVLIVSTSIEEALLGSTPQARPGVERHVCEWACARVSRYGSGLRRLRTPSMCGAKGSA